MTQATDSAASTLRQLAEGYQISQALHVTAELKVADLVGDAGRRGGDRAGRRRPSRQPVPPAPRARDGWSLPRDP